MTSYKLIYVPSPVLSGVKPQTDPNDYGIGYALFLLVNATLFIRPAELVPALDGWPIYQVLILLCLLVSVPRVIKEFSWGTLVRWPISLCVVGLLVAVVLSHLAHLEIGRAISDGLDFLKLVIYYVLLVTHVNSFARLKQFLLALVIFTTLMTALAVLQYHGLTNIEQLKMLYESQANTVDDETGNEMELGRLCSLGIFNNPNDLSRILVAGIFICLFFLGDKQQGMLRFFWALPLALLGYANALTYSRGGFLGLLGGLMLLFMARFGRARTIVLVVVVLPLLLLVFAGRQTSINFGEEDTGYARILKWRDGMVQLTHAPIFGVGANNYTNIAEGVAHNSFVHAFTELGLVGGSFFVGLFLFGIVPLYRARSDRVPAAERELWRLRAYVVAIMGAYAVGLLSSSRCYAEPTYTLAGIAAVCCRLLAPRAPKAITAFNGAAFRQLITVSLLVLAAHYIFIRIKT